MTKTSKKSKYAIGCLILGIILLACCSFMALFGLLVSEASQLDSQGYLPNIIQDGDLDNQIYIIDVEGVILNVDDGIYEVSLTNYILNGLDEALNDPTVKAVIIRLNTPGGSVYDSSLITNKIKELQANDKIVVTVMEEIAASGGYWIAAPTDQIYASPHTLTGSIGVLFEFITYDELLSKIGIRDIVITNQQGTNKILNDVANPESESFQIIETLADEEYDRFVNLILEGRNLNKSDIDPVIDGRILSAPQAKEYNLIDDFGDYTDGINYIENELGVENMHVTELVRTELIGFAGLSAKANAIFVKSDPNQNSAITLYALPEIIFE